MALLVAAAAAGCGDAGSNTASNPVTASDPGAPSAVGNQAPPVASPSPSTAGPEPVAHPPARLIGSQQLPADLQIGGTRVGGLSGIDYDPQRNRWLLLSDDRSEQAPARFYTATIAFDDHGLDPIRIDAVTLLRQPDGSPYPNRGAGGEVPDPESIRLDPADGSIWWTSEGDRNLGLDPAVHQAGIDGKTRATLPLSARFRMSPVAEHGPRNNATFEGLAFAPDGRSLWTAMEGPLYQDGPPSTGETGSLVRFSRFDREGGLLAEYAYPVDPLPLPPLPGKGADIGVTEILAVDTHRLLVIERAGIQGADGGYRNFIRLYRADLHRATDVSGVDTLTGTDIRPARKELLVDLATLGLPRIDNIEGMSWGPVLANGGRSLVLVSDDNFNRASQVTQVIVLALDPRGPLAVGIEADSGDRGDAGDGEAARDREDTGYREDTWWRDGAGPTGAAHATEAAREPPAPGEEAAAHAGASPVLPAP